MIEHKTFWLNDANEFDSYLLSYEREGWRVDSKSWGIKPDGSLVFMAFLSREVPDSPLGTEAVRKDANG